MAVELSQIRRSSCVFVFALEREAKWFRKQCPDARIHIIGVGATRAARNVRSLVERENPLALVLAGYGGALRSGLCVSDVIIANQVISNLTDDSARTPLLALRAHGLLTGSILSVNNIVGDVNEKKQLHEQFGCDAVDLESCAIAEVCDELGIPWAVVRVISDTVDRSLSPAIAKVFDNGEVSIGSVIKLILRQPTLIREFWKLAKDTRTASISLASVLATVLD